MVNSIKFHPKATPILLFSIKCRISSKTTGSSIVEGIAKSLPSAIYRIALRKILPDRVLGNRAAITARLKLATGPTVSRTILIKSFSSCSDDTRTFAFGTTKPTGTCPFKSSLIPITAHSATVPPQDAKPKLLPFLPSKVGVQLH